MFLIRARAKPLSIQRLKLAGTAIAAMNAGDVFVIETPGGGGFGKA